MQKIEQLAFLCLAVLLASCNNDDNGTDLEVVPPRPMAEVAAENDLELQEYFRTHFYNYEEFQNPPEGFDFQVRFDTIAGENADKNPLMEDIRDSVILVSSDAFGDLPEENDIPHTIYYLAVREGGGALPTFADSTFLRIEGQRLDGTVFQNRSISPTWFDLVFQPGGLIEGFVLGALDIKGGSDIMVNPDGTYDVQDYGIGAVFFPSGLGYFNVIRTNIPAYSPLIFKMDAFVINDNTDHDRDGVPSFLEDLDNDGDLINDDSDEDNIPDALDIDDDNDGIPTRDEIDFDDDGNLVLPDEDEDGTPDYLDSDN
ncbi:MAG: hypothetical protein AAFX53_13085 [Bacteroidota bacterium]